MLTLTRTRDAAARLLTLRSEIAERKAEADALTATLRDALPHWGPVNTGTRSVFLAASSTLDPAHLQRGLGQDPRGRARR